jgi:hypothetical protein
MCDNVEIVYLSLLQDKKKRIQVQSSVFIILFACSGVTKKQIRIEREYLELNPYVIVSSGSLMSLEKMR